LREKRRKRKMENEYKQIGAASFTVLLPCGHEKRVERVEKRHQMLALIISNECIWCFTRYGTGKVERVI
jgi:hypothetical protein